MQEDQIEKVYNVLKDFSTVMLTTTTDERHFHARPMAVAQVDSNCDSWFFTDRSSPKVDEIRHDQHVLLTCQKDHSQYLALTGIAELVTDKAKAAELWKESFKVWFPDGVEDPNLLVVRVRAERAEYWDNSGAEGIRYLYEATKAYLSGTRPNIKEGEQHGKVNLV